MLWSFPQYCSEHEEVLVWGWNGNGQLGLGNSDIRLSPTPLSQFCGTHIQLVSCGCYHSILRTEKGEMFVWGYNHDGQLGLGVMDTGYHTPQLNRQLSKMPIVSLSCGYAFNAVTLDSGHVYTWGNNGSGQLGVGDNTSKSVPMVSALPAPARMVACSSHSVVAHLVSGKWYVWGHNAQKELCLGHNVNQSSPQELPYSVGSALYRSHVVTAKQLPSLRMGSCGCGDTINTGH
eukprot:TRINITY_DN940_c0_g2_i5.p1 TRINITY_DN940_c0_g2~~TRINITY_DN940_c0_g2_i5.p1  ORF type:complete len:233 (+),score=17.85 TRINITY_DN940_c0_g2_i5:604-1302(+)